MSLEQNRDSVLSKPRNGKLDPASVTTKANRGRGSKDTCFLISERDGDDC
jgi:hypothetical protein